MEIVGKTIQIDKSGGHGHCWEVATQEDCGADAQEMIAAEIIDGGIEETDGMEICGQWYRW